MVSSAKGLAYVFSTIGNVKSHKASSSPLVLVDGTALLFRSYFAMPSMRRPIPDRNDQAEDREVGAIVGFCNSLISILLPAPSDSTVMVLFDSPGPTFRQPMFPEYKAQRPEPPEDLGPQFSVAIEACRAFGWGAYAAPGFEADDVIATMAKVASDNNQERTVTIVGSDKDFYQLVTDTCFVICPSKKVLVTAAEVEAKFGVPPRLMVDLQSLMGDSVDNIKGIPGIGPKTGSELLRQFGSLEGVLDNAHLVKQPKRRESLLQHRAAALLARQLVTLHAEVPPSALLPPLQDLNDLESLLTSSTPTDFTAAAAFCETNHLWTVARSLNKKKSLLRKNPSSPMMPRGG